MISVYSKSSPHGVYALEKNSSYAKHATADLLGTNVPCTWYHVQHSLDKSLLQVANSCASGVHAVEPVDNLGRENQADARSQHKQRHEDEDDWSTCYCSATDKKLTLSTAHFLTASRVLGALPSMYLAWHDKRSHRCRNKPLQQRVMLLSPRNTSACVEAVGKLSTKNDTNGSTNPADRTLRHPCVQLCGCTCAS